MGILQKASFWVLALASLSAPAVDVVTHNPNSRCELYELNSDLNVYRDPSLYASDLGQGDLDRNALEQDFPDDEKPLLTTVSGKVHLKWLEPPREFKGFRTLTKLFDIPQPRVKRIGRGSDDLTPGSEHIDPNLVIPIWFCDQHDTYYDHLGYVFYSDLENARRVRNDVQAGTPPSIEPNPIPHVKIPGSY